MFSKLSIRAKLLLTFVVVTLFAVTILGGINLYRSSQVINETLDEEMSYILRMAEITLNTGVKESMSGYLKQKSYESLQTIRRIDTVGGQSVEQKRENAIREIFAEPCTPNGFFSLLDTRGNVLFSSGKLTGISNVRQSRERLTREQYQFLIDYATNRLVDRPEVFDDEQLAGFSLKSNVNSMFSVLYYTNWECILVYQCPITDLTNLINWELIFRELDKLKIGENGYLQIIDLNRFQIYHPNRSLIGKQFNGSVNQAMIKQRNGKFRDVQISTMNNKKGQMKLYTFSFYEPTEWIISAGVYVDELEGGIQSLIELNAVIVGITALAMMLAGWLIGNYLRKSISVIDKKLKNIASESEKADLTAQIKVKNHDELGEIVNDVNLLMRRLNKDIGNVKLSSNRLSESSERLTQMVRLGIRSVVDGIRSDIGKINGFTEDQTSGIEQMNATLEEISRNVESIGENINRQSAAVEESASSVEQMSKNIENTARITMDTRSISEQLNLMAMEGGVSVKDSILAIREVSEYSQQILKMLKLITDISKQTNLLAMNASIEAAHAGEAGKGFAIVADEIRRLAESTNKNAKDIGEVVNSIVAKIGESVMLSEKGGMGLDSILKFSAQNLERMSQLAITMEEQSESAKEILKSTQEIVQITEVVKFSMQEQKTGNDEFGLAMRSIRDLSMESKKTIQSHLVSLKELMKSIEEISSILKEHSKLSDDLENLIGKFVLSETQAAESSSLRLVD